jgi:hypothetical protein
VQENSKKRKKLTKYTKKVKIVPNLNKEFEIMWKGIKKNERKKNKKKEKFFPECQHLALGDEARSRELKRRHSGKIFLKKKWPAHSKVFGPALCGPIYSSRWMNLR